MGLLIVHISDIHCVSSETKILDSASAIVRAINSHEGNFDKIVYVVSGDITYSGVDSQFAIADLMFQKLADGTRKYEPVFVMCPGNHDNNHEKVGKIREYSIAGVLSAEKYDQEVVDEITKVQNDYQCFSSKYSAGLSRSRLLSTVYEFMYKGYKLNFNSLNSVWMSNIKVTPGHVYIDDSCICVEGSSLSLSVLVSHFTLNWLSSGVNRRLRNEILARYQFVFTGHEHMSDGYVLDSFQNDSGAVMVEGAELSPEKDCCDRGFNMVLIDVVGQKFKMYKYSCCADGNLFECVNLAGSEWKSYCNKSCRSNGGVEVNRNLLAQIDDPGATYCDGKVGQIKLEDIFIYPDVMLREKHTSKGLKRQLIVNTKKVFAQPVKAFFYGGEKSGKTALCNSAFIDYFRRGNFPVLVGPGDFSRRGGRDYDAIIARIIEAQYSSEAVERIRQADKSAKVLLFDDFHNLEMNCSEKIVLIKALCSMFDNVAIFSDDSRQYDEVFGKEDEFKVMSCFSRYKLMEFGHKLRDEMIEKWFGIAGGGIDSPSVKRKDSIAQMLDTLVQSNYVPAYPFYMYTAISEFDNSSSTLAKSSYGHYYDVLLIKALARIDIKAEEIDLRKNYLTELAYYFYSTGASILPENKINEFHLFYCKEYDLQLSCTKMLNGFFTASLLAHVDGMIYFKYKYFYHYFLARYIANNMHKDDVRDVVSLLCRNMHTDFSSSMLMFVTHQSKDPSIIVGIVDKAKNLFSKHTSLRLDDDGNIVNELLAAMPDVIIKDISVSDARKAQLAARDNMNAHEPFKDIYGDNIKFESEELATEADSLSTSIDATYKALDISGQLLKSYFGSLKGSQKYSICEQGFQLPLRALNDFFEYLAKDKEFLLQEMRSTLVDKSKKLKTQADVEQASRQCVFNYAAFICAHFIKKASSSLANENLKLTYSSVLANNNYPSARLIGFAMRLDSACTISDQDIKELRMFVGELKSEKNFIALAILRFLIIYHMYMFHVDYKHKQQIYEMLGISVKNQTLLQVESAERGAMMGKH